jgi:hypothetical protein
MIKTDFIRSYLVVCVLLGTKAAVDKIGMRPWYGSATVGGHKDSSSLLKRRHSDLKDVLFRVPKVELAANDFTFVERFGQHEFPAGLCRLHFQGSHLVWRLAAGLQPSI